jgi:hypothetical protein
MVCINNFCSGLFTSIPEQHYFVCFQEILDQVTRSRFQFILGFFFIPLKYLKDGLDHNIAWTWCLVGYSICYFSFFAFIAAAELLEQRIPSFSQMKTLYHWNL